MGQLFSARIRTEFGQKELAVFCDDITTFSGRIDILTTSAFQSAYNPTPRTVFEALERTGLSVAQLARSPEIDLRSLCHTWLSKENPILQHHIRRVGCVELMSYELLHADPYVVEQRMINTIRAYFSMLDIAAMHGIKMQTLALPLLGGGCQQVNPHMMLVPLVNECIAFLKRNEAVERIFFIERSPEKAAFIAQYLQNSGRIHLEENAQPPAQILTDRRTVFLSYSTPDRNIADNLCAKLESRGMKVWYAPRNVRGPYAQAIAEAIDRSAYFVVILSQSSMMSEHVLNEIDLAFQNLPSRIRFKPLRIDELNFSPSFKYYLSRQHYMDAVNPPLEERLNEFVEELVQEALSGPEGGSYGTERI